MIPDIILGAGPSGLMVANRLKSLGRPFLILERGKTPMSNTGNGFFYLHDRINGTETEIRVIVTSCPGADPEIYAKKVYGDPRVPVSIKTQAGDHIGYRLDASSLLGPVKESVFTEVDIAFIDTETHLVFSKNGNSWPYNHLHSTIPLPIFSKMMPKAPSLKFNSKPIWIEDMPINRVSLDLHPRDNEMRAHYCPGICHDWYRVTTKDRKAQFERVDQTAYSGFPIYPGKIWLDPNNKANEQEELNQYRFYLSSKGIYLWGRYAEWKPKHLLHNVWSDLKTKL